MLARIQAAAADETWSAGVRLSRDAGALRLESSSADEIRVSVRAQGRALPYEVFLWPLEQDWQCDCPSRASVCAHVVAAAIFQDQQSKNPPPPASSESAPTRRLVRVALARAGQGGLTLKLQVSAPRGQGFVPLQGSIASSGAWARPGDLAVETALCTNTVRAPGAGATLPRELWPVILTALKDTGEPVLDDAPIKVSDQPLGGLLLVEDEPGQDRGRGFVLRLVRDPRIDESFACGVVRCGDTLHPLGFGDLRPDMRQRLQVGWHFPLSDLKRLVGEFIPSLRRHLVVELRTARLPSGEQLKPELRLRLESLPDHELRLLPLLVYGNPPVARVDAGELRTLTEVIPIRDFALEARRVQEAQRLFDVSPGRVRTLPLPEALSFVSKGLGGFKGPIDGQDVLAGYHLRQRALKPSLQVSEGRNGRYKVEVQGDGASAEALLQAWERGSSLVPLLEGGFAPLPGSWLQENGWRLAELLSIRDDSGEVPAHALPSVSRLATDTDSALPPSLQALRRSLEGFDGLPEVPLPTGLHAELRAYQRRGFDWLCFLRDAGLGGVLADDMGLGKTLQALCALSVSPGPSLVVAPTSVLHNWCAEAGRFLPGMKVCLYSGPERAIDPQAELVVTSYALLRRDIDQLSSINWVWAILDEAQAIKNPDSQVARAARRLDARHRLVLTGTPIENRLEELWSLFAFVMPGFLGHRRDFSSRLDASLSVAVAGVDPSAALDSAPRADRAGALGWLRQRVRPFILRRLKRDVAPELPPRTDSVWRCEMGEDQRSLYQSIRRSSLGELRRALGSGRMLSVLETLLRLRQAACHPSLLPGVELQESAKVEALMETLPVLAQEGHRALVFSQWTGLLDLLEVEIRAAGLDFCRLDGSTRDRAAVVERFQSPQGPPVFLISLKAGGTGLNLTAADYVFHMDPWWNPAVEDQAVDRAHRIGQTRPVFSVRLVSSGTVEERILTLQQAKRGLADVMLSGENAFFEALSRDELLSLFE